MKTRMHRFWLSVTLAAGSLASPWTANLLAHDLPWRWASDTVASSEWNYLRDDCLDSRALSPYGDALSRSLESSRGGCPTEEAVAGRFDAALARKTQANFADEMACWASKWELIQKKAGAAARASLAGHRHDEPTRWAARPDFGVPPAPATPIVDTCGYGAEYFAMQAAADLLETEMARAAAISVKEAELSRALDAAADIEAATIDTIAASDLAGAEASERPLCGGATSEIVSEQRPHSDFAPPVDEYMAYDLDGRDAHWLGGLNKSWRLRAAISAAAAADEAAEHFGADELLEGPALASADATESLEIIEAPFVAAPVDDDYALCDFVGPTAPATARTSTLVAAQPDAGFAPAPSQSAFALKDRLADALVWLDHAACVISAEMCGLDQTHRLGEQWGDWALSGAQRSMTTYVAMGHYLNLPPMVYEPQPDLEPRSDVYVVYTDSQGNESLVPSTLAPAWNAVSNQATHSDAALDEASYLEDELAAFQSEEASDAEPVAETADFSPASQPIAQPASLPASLDLASLRRHVLNLVARKLDAFGLSCLQTADHLSNWADTQIASREDSDVR